MLKNKQIRAKMSATVMSTNVVASVPAAARKKIEPWTPKELKKEMKDVNDFVRRVEAGLHVIPPSEQYLNKTKDMARRYLELAEQVQKDYEELYESTESKRITHIKPRLCDRALTDLLARHFKKMIPESNQYGVLDLNRIAPRAISLYVKEKGLGLSQYFNLDDDLTRLFSSPSVEDKNKTYLQLAQQRIDQIRAEPGYKPSSSSADISVVNGTVTMNYSALKIIIPKFGVNYDLSNPDDYVEPLQRFADHLEDLHNKFEEAKKSAKKTTKAK
jgi:hypothetical protein